MPQPRPWLDEIIDALEELEGQGSLADIYATIANRKIMDFETNLNWNAAVRRTIEQHSSDSDAFTGNLEDDLFYAPKGKGAGYWAIRDYEEAAKDIRSRTVEEETEGKGNDITQYEGTLIQRFVNIYERKPALRAAAIRIHGTICKGCGFNFELVYGPRGRGFIEVHHLRPISSFGGSVQVSPREDMTVLCSNCHRMIHRHQHKVLSLEELQALIEAYKTVS